MFKDNIRSRRIASYVCIAFLLSVMLVSVQAPHISAQTQYVTATPGYVNLGMNTTISINAPSGSYTLVDQDPSNVESNFTVTSTGQVMNQTFEASSVGTYNVFLVSGGTTVSSTSFYATNRLIISMDMVDGGTCAYVAGITRGVKMFPRFSITFASNGAQVTNNDKGISVVFTQPGGGKVNASWDAFAGLFVGKVLPNWNYTNVGSWNPTAVVSDAAGNTATFNYTGSPYVISPSPLSTSILLVDSNTNQTVTSISSSENVTVYATIAYPTNAEPVTGFVAPLDATTRGGVVSGIVGYGTYNATSQSFTGTGAGTVASVALTYTGSNGVWKGSFNTGTLPSLSSPQTIQVVIPSPDKATPPNTGSATLGVALGATPGSPSPQTTSSAATSGSTIPVWAYAGTTIALIIGVIVGFLARKK